MKGLDFHFRMKGGYRGVHISRQLPNFPVSSFFVSLLKKQKYLVFLLFFKGLHIDIRTHKGARGSLML